jgi:hypothetical protein
MIALLIFKIALSCAGEHLSSFSSWAARVLIKRMPDRRWGNRPQMEYLVRMRRPTVPAC